MNEGSIIEKMNEWTIHGKWMKNEFMNEWSMNYSTVYSNE